MSKIYSFICWICFFHKKVNTLNFWFQLQGRTHRHWDRACSRSWWESLLCKRAVKGLPNKDEFQLEQEIKEQAWTGYCCDLLPTQLQRDRQCCGRRSGLLTGCIGAAAALWYLQKLGSRILEQEKSPVTVVWVDKRQMCCSSQRQGLGSSSAILCCMWYTGVGFRTPVPAAGPSQQLGILPTPNLLLSHRHSSCALPFISHFLHCICTMCLSHNQSSYIKTV